VADFESLANDFLRRDPEGLLSPGPEPAVDGTLPPGDQALLDVDPAPMCGEDTPAEARAGSASPSPEQTRWRNNSMPTFIVRNIRT
jgi:hypothetical protein